QRGLRAFLVFVLTLAAAVCLVMGLTLPVVKLTRLYFWTDTHSIISIISALYYTGEVFLAGVIFVFSVVFPAFKLLYITMAGTLITFNPARRSRWFKRIEWLGKWSMLDVLMLALLVFYAKSAELTDAVALPGIYFFAASVILTMIAYSLVDREELSMESRKLTGADSGQH
ncbi:MAG: paraquat-inducible protein A, partial [Rhodomicrobium sp.]|nr:paraquat-inducible protein A [Rhodomicrobium sp.]